MSTNFFSLLGKVNYPTYNDNYLNYTLSTNIGSRFIFKEQILTDLLTYEYYVQDGERPEQVSYYYYGSVDLVWLIFFANDIIDPYYDWPLSNKDLESYINEKYRVKSINPNTEIHHYERIIFPTQQAIGGNSYVPEITEEVPFETWTKLPTNERKSVTYTNYEYDLNEEKRKIYLIEDVYVPQIVKKVKQIFG